MKIKILLLASVILIIGCKQTSKKDNVLSVSIEPQRYFLEQLVGDKFSVNTLIPPGSNPETSDPSPSQMVALSKSIAYFKVGHLGFENKWVDSSQKNVSDIALVDCSEGIEPVEDHVCEHHHEHSHGHEGGDPHIWSSPQTAKKMVDNMYRALIKIDSANTAYYAANYKKLESKIDSVENVIKQTLENSENKSFIIYHPALTYFANEYGLTQHSIENEGKSPSPSQLRSLIDKAKNENIRVVFIQAEFDTKNAEIIANEISAKIVPINLLSYDWEGEMIKVANTIAGK